MRKKAIAVLLSLAMTVGCVGAVPVIAAEATEGQESTLQVTEEENTEGISLDMSDENDENSDLTEADKGSTDEVATEEQPDDINEKIEDISEPEQQEEGDQDEDLLPETSEEENDVDIDGQSEENESGEIEEEIQEEGDSAVNSESASFVSLGDEYYVKETIIGESIDAHELIGKELSKEEITAWRSSAPEIAEIDENGIITALSDGEARINVDAEGATESFVLVVYKHWGYDIEFDANGGTGEMEPMQGLTPDENYELTHIEFSKNGYSFNGWEYVDKDGMKTVFDDCDVVSNLAGHGDTVVLKASWNYRDAAVRLDGIPKTGNIFAFVGDRLIVSAETGTLIASYQFISPDGTCVEDDFPTVSTAKSSIDFGKLKEGTYAISWTTARISTTATSYGVHSYIINVIKEQDTLDDVDITETSIELTQDIYTYTGEEVTPIIVIYYNSIRLLEGRDYTIECTDNIEVGHASVTIIGQGRFTGTITRIFWIVEEGDKVSLLNDMTEVTGLYGCLYDGSAQTLPYLKVRVDTILLEEGKDYTLSYKDNVNVGMGKVLITGIGIFKDTIEAEFKIRARSIQTATVTGIEDKTYTGETIEQDINVNCKGIDLVRDKDYTVSYNDNVEPGTAEIVINGIGNYTGTITSYFEILNQGWKKEENGWKYYKADGIPATGWLKDGGTWYYMNEEGIMQTGWQKLNGIWYYMNGSGAMVTGWQKIGNTWYYFNGSGAMVTGWQKIGSTWYYFSGSGAMVTSWQKIGSTWYYFNTSGAMQTGWQKIGSTWYYFSSGGAMQTGWQKINNKWYYFKSSGAMVTGRQQIDGKWYTFSSSGAMQ